MRFLCQGSKKRAIHERVHGSFMDIMDWIGEKENLVLKHSIHNGVLQSYHLANSGTKVWLLGHPSEAIVANSDKRG